MFPEIKKNITSFLMGEEGKISKQALLSGGAFLGTGILSAVLLAGNVSADHSNTLTLDYATDTAQASHAHHSSAAHTSAGYDTSWDYTWGGGGI